MDIIKKIGLKTKQDLYLLQVVNDFIVTNNGNSGIKIFDASLNIIKELTFLNKVSVYYIYKHFFRSEIILYCYENICLIWLNLLTFDWKIISLNKAFMEKAFSPAYHWDNDYIILSTYDYQYYILNIKTGFIHKLEYNVVRATCPQLSLLMEIRSENPLIELKNSYLIEEKKDWPYIKIITPTITKTITRPAFPYHDIEYINNLIIFVGHTHIQVVKSEGKKVTLEPEAGYQFLKADIGKKFDLVTLCGGIHNLKDSLLTIYKIVE